MFKPVKQRHDKVLIIGGGESLVGFDMSRLKYFQGAIITVNNVVYHLPRADYWITVDPMANGKPQHALKYKVRGVYYYCTYPDLEKTPWDIPYYQTVPRVHYLERVVPEEDYSLQEDKTKITTGDSCYGALGLAYHFGPSKIAILGVDAYGFGHWYDKQEPYNREYGDNFDKYLNRIPRIYKASVKQLKERNIEVVLGSPESKIDCFDKMTPEEAFSFITD